MKKAIFINDHIIAGGTERILALYAAFFARKGYRVYVAAPGSRKIARGVFGDEIRFIHMSRQSGRYQNWSLPWFVDRVLSHFEYYLYSIWAQFHSFDLAIAMKENRPMLEVKKLWAKKKVAWIQSDYRDYHSYALVFKSPEAELKCMAGFQHVICVSKSAMDGVIQTIGDPGNLAVCYNPIDYKRIRSLSEQRILSEKPADRFLFVSVGRLDPHKQYSMLIEICSILEKKFDFELWILGDGPQEKRLKEMIRELGIRSVKLLGFCENPFPYLKIADCAISSSKSESYGLAIQEALILGVPVVATRCPAIEECLDPRFGMICDNSLEGLKTAMETILSNPSLLNEYRDNNASFYSVDDLYDTRLNAAYDLIDNEPEAIQSSI